MALKSLNKRERVAEDEYFYRHDAALLDHMREQAAVEEERRRLAEASKIQDQGLLDDLARAGVNPSNATLLHLLPLIQVAWVDGSVSRAERDRIVKVARLRGIEAGCTADQQLTMWLDERPSDEVFETAVRALRASIDALPPDQHETSASSLLERCASVAAASGTFLGLTTPVSALLKDLARKLWDHPRPNAVAGTAAL